MSEEETFRPAPVPKELQEKAVRAALEGRWQEAERINRLLLEKEPDNVDALNRLGKALLELGRYDEAYAAYGRALELDPYNRIARKNRERLAPLLQAETNRARGEVAEREQIVPDLFISESGKSAVVPLRAVAGPGILARLARGETVRLEASGQNVLVKTEEGETLGRLDPRVGRRLTEFIQVGNRYAAAIAEVDEDSVKVFVREIYQHPNLLGRLSFPPIGVAQAELVRPYIRDLGLRIQEALEADLDEEDVEEEEEEEGTEEEPEEGIEEEPVEEEVLLEEMPEEEAFTQGLGEES